MAALVLLLIEWCCVAFVVIAIALAVTVHPAWFAAAIASVAVGLWARSLAASGHRDGRSRHWLGPETEQ